MLENWGLMTKAQDDSQTIQDAIDASILAHKNDPESHMGAGESIENHRINEVLDHPAGSVLADKSTTKEIEIRHQFMPIDNYSVVGTGTYEFHQEWVAGGALYFEGATGSLNVNTLLPFTIYDSDLMFQFSGQATDFAHWTGYFGFYSRPSTTITDGFGFKFVNGNCYAFAMLNSGMALSSALTYNIEIVNQYRIIFSFADKTWYFFINGVNVAVIVEPSELAGVFDGRPQFWGKADTSGASVNFVLSEWYFSSSLIT